MSSSKTVSTPVRTDAACEGTQDDEDRAGASLANLLSVKRREHLVEHDREKQALLSLEALLQEETQPVRERVAKLLEIALPSRMLCDVEQGGALFEDPGLATMFRARLQELSPGERQILILLSLLSEGAAMTFLERLLDAALPSIDFFESVSHLHERGLLLLQHDVQEGEDGAAETLVTLTPWMRGFLRTHNGGGESLEDLDVDALTIQLGRFLADDFQPHLEEVIFLGAELDRARIMSHMYELQRVYQSKAWSGQTQTTPRDVIEQILVLHELATSNWSAAHELTRSWEVFEHPQCGEELTSSREKRTAACLYLRVLALSDNPSHALTIVRQWLQELTLHAWEQGVRGGLAREELDRFRVALIVEAVETASRSEHFDHIDPLLEQGYGLCQKPAMRVQRGRLLLMSGVKSVHQRDWPHAQAMFQEAEHLFSRADHVRLLGHATYHLGHIYKHLHRDAQSWSAYEEARQLAMRSQDVSALTEIHRELVWTWLDRGEWDKAREEVESLEALLTHYEESARIKGVAHMLRGQLSMQRGALKDALVELELARWHLASSQQHYLLVATFYFEFLCYWALDNRERACAYLELGEHLSTELTSMMAQTCYGCAKIMIHVWDEELDEAMTIVESLRELHATSMTTSWLAGLLDVHEFHVHLNRYLVATRSNKKRTIKAMTTMLLRQGIDLQLRANRGAMVTDFNAEVRFCWGYVKRHIPASLGSMIELGLVDPTGEALIVDRAQQMFRAPEQNTWVHMKRRSTPFKLLCTLVEQRLQQPGVAIDASDLFERVWPGESILQESAQNRLYVTINGLRKEGLKDVLISTPEGYMLKQSVRLIDI